MSDEPKKRSWTRVGWSLLALFVLYPASIFPVTIACRWLIWFEALNGNSQALHVLNTFYAPVVWVFERSPAINQAEACPREAESS
jgi:hypothetical protein